MAQVFSESETQKRKERAREGLDSGLFWVEWLSWPDLGNVCRWSRAEDEEAPDGDGVLRRRIHRGINYCPCSDKQYRYDISPYCKHQWCLEIAHSRELEKIASQAAFIAGVPEEEPLTLRSDSGIYFSRLPAEEVKIRLWIDPDIGDRVKLSIGSGFGYDRFGQPHAGYHCVIRPLPGMEDHLLAILEERLEVL